VLIENFRIEVADEVLTDLRERIARDQLLTDLTIYWATATINASTRVYYEERQAPPSAARVPVPAGFAVFANEGIRAFFRPLRG
jgi:hypothetical protein